MNGLRITLLSIAAALALFTVGCRTMQVNALPARDVVDLSADDVVRIMREAGFDDEEILTHGTALRDSLALSGGARMVKGSRTEAMFSAYSHFVHVTTRDRRNFAYDVDTGGFLVP